MPETHRRLVKAWIEFYHTHKRELAVGEFAPFGEMDRPDQKIEAPGATYVFARSSHQTVPLRAPQTTYLVNGADEARSQWSVTGLRAGRYRATVFDRFLQTQNVRTLSLSRNGNLNNLPVEKAGLLRLERLAA